jgi:uncharacterized membrane protein
MTPRLTQNLSRLAAVGSFGVALVSYRYLADARLGIPQVLANLFARPWLFIHVAGAATALLIGPLNFVGALRRRAPAVHRWVGRVYIAGCLIGGLGGLVCAFGSTAGPVATAGFGSLAVFWIVFNTLGYLTARRRRRFADHRAWMIRSFALTFGAVTLRLYLPLVPLLPISFLDGYRAISFLAWVPNLILAEIYLRGGFRGWSGGRVKPQAA